MRSRRRTGIGAVVAGLVLGTVQAAGAAPPPAATAGLDTVTLITGDQVDMVGENDVTVRPGKGREKVLFSTHTVDGHVFVVPGDAMRLVASGRLDRRLFDVTTLREFGYDDAKLSHETLREQWFAAGAKWWSRSPRQPASWRAIEQLEQAGLTAPCDQPPRGRA